MRADVRDLSSRFANGPIRPFAREQGIQCMCMEEELSCNNEGVVQQRDDRACEETKMRHDEWNRYTEMPRTMASRGEKGSRGMKPEMQARVQTCPTDFTITQDEAKQDHD